MRIVLIGISHWHTPFYSDPVLVMKNATIVGVSDPDAERAAPLAVERPDLERRASGDRVDRLAAQPYAATMALASDSAMFEPLKPDAGTVIGHSVAGRHGGEQ